MKKKFTAGILSLSLAASVCSAFPVSAAEIVASGECGTEVCWTLDSEGTLVISGPNSMNDYRYEIIGYDPSAGGEVDVEWSDEAPPWFEVRDSITKIIVEEGVLSVGRCAFMDCDNVTEIVLPDSIRYIQHNSMLHCDRLEKVNIPGENLVYVMSGAFSKNISLESIVLPEELDELPTGTFDGCISLKEVVVPEAVEYMGASVFGDCHSLEDVFILSRTCDICDDAGTVSNYRIIDTGEIVFNGTIYGYRGSTAEAYAEKYGRTFKAIDDFTLGDVDFSGGIDSSDASMLLAQYAVTATGGDSLMNSVRLEYADVNGDSVVDSSDASSVLAYYAYIATGGTTSLEGFLTRA